MLNKLDIANVLFLDIETVSEKANYEELSETFQELWKLKCRQILKKYDEPITDEEASATYIEKAGIFAEFGKIVCISVGIVVRGQDKKLSLRLNSYYSDDEKKLLREFSHLVSQYYNNTFEKFLCGHNIKEFDIPYICRRMVINQLPLPHALNLAGKKPWENKHLLDTLVLWKFGDYKHYTSLKLLAAILGFPSPKDDIDGSNVGKVYWREGDLQRIAVYCEKDVLATTQLFLRYKMMPLLEEEQINSVTQWEEEIAST